MTESPPNPRAWLFRVASNLWLNERRRLRIASTHAEESDEVDGAREPRGPREAAGTLLGQLSPQERASVVLKDVFDLSLDEIAAALSTSPGAIKTALHRGRTKLVAPEPEAKVQVSRGVLDAFCDAFNARDLNRLTALLLDSATMEFPGILVEYGTDAMRAGSLQNTLFGCPDGRYVVTEPPRCELRLYRGEPILLWWLGDVVDAVVRVTVQSDRIAAFRNYRHAPELLTEVCRELEVPVTTHGYRPQNGDSAMSVKKTKSADGTVIAFETVGSGPAVVLIGGAFNDRSGRASGTPLAALLASDFTAVSYDRRGRGGSGNASDYAVAREIEDLASVITEIGGSAFVYGMSSGGILALAAAAHGLPITKVAVYEPPLLLDADRIRSTEALAVDLELATKDQRRSDAVSLFLGRVMQMPAQAVEGMRRAPMWPALEALSHTLSYDMHVTLQSEQLLARAPSITLETLVMKGESCAPWMGDAIQALVDALPNGRPQTLAGQTHDVDIKVLAPALRAFFIG